MKLLIGMDVGGTKCAVISGIVENDQLRILQREAFPTPKDQSEAIDRMCEIAEKLAGDTPIAAIGISAGGPMDAEKGMLLNPPNLPGWTGISMTDMMSQRLNAPAKMENDANACALAEYRFGAGRGSKNMAFLTFGTGLGAGLVLNGSVYAGSTGNAGELGHWRLSPFGPVGYGKMGAFEGFCSGGGMAQLAETIDISAMQSGVTTTFHGHYDVKSVAEAARAGDPYALQVFSTCAEKLGFGLSLLVDLLDLDCIVLGSIFPRCQDLLEEQMQEAYRREVLPFMNCKIVPAQLGEQIGDFAALSVAALQI